ncbi:MAG: hypothetical protein H0W84_05555 [Bacteroidetes bacterium]|nr:hypothetical protein [Bacteroidota bacterium]
MKNFWKIVIAIFMLSTTAAAQPLGSAQSGPLVTNKNAKEQSKLERKKEKEKRREDRKVMKFKKKEATQKNVKPRYKGIFRKRKKEASKNRKEIKN